MLKDTFVATADTVVLQRQCIEEAIKWSLKRKPCCKN